VGPTHAIPRTLVIPEELAPGTMIVVPEEVISTATQKTLYDDIRRAAQSEVLAEELGKLNAIENNLASKPMKGRNATRLKTAKANIESNIAMTRRNLNRLGATKEQKNPTHVPLGHTFDPIRNGNGPIEHYVILGSSREAQTGIGKAIGDMGLDGKDVAHHALSASFSGGVLSGAVQSAITFLSVLMLMVVLVVAAISTGNIYLWVVIIIIAVVGLVRMNMKGMRKFL